jgi:hypothetical protein
MLIDTVSNWKQIQKNDIWHVIHTAVTSQTVTTLGSLLFKLLEHFCLDPVLCLGLIYIGGWIAPAKLWGITNARDDGILH